MARERGAALLLALFLSGVVVILATAILQQVVVKVRYAERHLQSVASLYAAQAGLEQVKRRVRASGYGSMGNAWLRAHAAPEGYPAIEDLEAGAGSVDVTIYDLEDGWFRAVATGRAGVETFRLSMELTDRDPFSRFMFLNHDADMRFGETTVRGHVHSNRRVVFVGGGATMYGAVTAAQGIEYESGASPDNTTFHGEVDGGADPIPWPDAEEVAALQSHAAADYDLSSAHPWHEAHGAFDTEIELDGDQIRVKARDRDSGELLDEGTYALPPNALLFVEGSVTSLEGDIAGQLTIATLGGVDITGPVRYVDANGNPAYQLLKDGEPIEDTPEGVVWDEADGYTYERNPAYAPDTPSRLGIVAVDDVRVDAAAPYNMVVHAAVFSAEGNWHCDLSEKKGNLRFLGSIARRSGGWRFNSLGYGWALSGAFIYDETLIHEPPMHFFGIDAPVFASWRRG